MSSIERIKKQLAHVFQEYGLDKAAVFGSYARGEEREDSDVDLLIFSKRVFDLDTYGEFEEALEKAAGKKVDLVFDNYINPYMKDEILKEAISIYEQ